MAIKLAMRVHSCCHDFFALALHSMSWICHTLVSKTEFCSFAKSLSTNSSLEVLNFNGNRIGCERAELLAQSLRSNSKLRALYLSGNEIKDRGACALAKALSVNYGLKYLRRYDNPLGEDSIQQLIGSFQQNHTLKSIYLPILWEKFSHNCNGFNKTRCHFYFY